MKRALLLICFAAVVAPAQEHWVSTWGTSQQIYRPAPVAPAGGGAFGASGGRAGGNAAAPTGPRFNTANNQTMRMIVHTSIGGKRVRVQLTNPFGGTKVQVGSAHIAVRDKDVAIVAATDRPLTVSGQKTFTMLPGSTTITDPVDLTFAPLSDLAISLYFPGDAGQAAAHGTALHTTYISGTGDFAAQASFDAAFKPQAYYWISTVDVVAPAASAIVALGDSITDGTRSTPDTNHSWPALLAARLQQNKATADIAVVNQGISGNRVLADGSGVAVLARFDHDVLEVPGVKWVLYLEGINDIGALQRQPELMMTADDLIAATKQLILKAHDHGIKIIGCTLTPYNGANYFSERGEAVRTAYNTWIRKGGAFDAVIDFDAITRDPAAPTKFRTEVQSGDWLHPNDVGYQAMADGIDLKLFTAKK